MFFDLHNDFPTMLSLDDYEGYISKLGKDITVTAAIWTSEFKDNAEKNVVDLTYRLRRISLTIPIAIEDIGFLAEGERFRSFDFSCYSYCSLTWNYDNAFAGGALDDGALTGIGRRVIDILNEQGCALDLAHLNRKSFFSALDSSEYVLCSHTGFNSHRRSLNGEQIAALVKRRALIGLCTVSAFTDAHNAVEFGNAVDRFVQRYGDDCLAIGTDYYGSSDIPSDISDYNTLECVRILLENLGYSRNSIDKIFFGNAVGFFDRRLK